jgi:hypothetical protein
MDPQIHGLSNQPETRFPTPLYLSFFLSVCSVHGCTRVLASSLSTQLGRQFFAWQPAAAGSEAGVLKKLSLAGLGKLSQLSYC